MFLPETLDTSQSSGVAVPSDTMISGKVDIPEPSMSSIIVVMLSSSISTVETVSEVERLDDDESSGIVEELSADDGDDGLAAFVVCLGSPLKPEPSSASRASGATSLAPVGST